MQVHTARTLADAYTAASRPADAAFMLEELSKKSSDLTEATETEAAKAESKLQGIRAAAAAKEAEVRSAWAAAAESGVPGILLHGDGPSDILTDSRNGVTGDASGWLGAVKQRLGAAKAVEAANRTQQTFAGDKEVQTVLLGKEVEALMSGFEGSAAAELRAVEGVAGAVHARSAIQVVRSAQRSLARHAASSGGRYAVAARECFLDCLPERRMVWMALMGHEGASAGSSTGRGAAAPAAVTAGAAAAATAAGVTSTYGSTAAPAVPTATASAAAHAQAASAHAASLLALYAAGAGAGEGAAARDGAVALLRRLATLLQRKEEAGTTAGRDVAHVLEVRDGCGVWALQRVHRGDNRGISWVLCCIIHKHFACSLTVLALCPVLITGCCSSGNCNRAITCMPGACTLSQHCCTALSLTAHWVWMLWQQQQSCQGHAWSCFA